MAWATFTPKVRTVDGRWSTVRELRVRTADGQWTRTWPPPAATTTTVTHPGGTVTHGTTVSLPVAVTAAEGTPDGSVSMSLRVSGGQWVEKRVLPLVAGRVTYQYTVDSLGPVEWRAVYQPAADSRYTASTGTTTATYAMPAMGALTTGSLGYDSATFSWASVSGATGYQVWRNGVLLTTVTGASFTATGLNHTTEYAFKVRAVATVSGGPFYSNYSAEKTARMGKPAEPVTGSFTRNCAAVKTGSFQRDGQGAATYSGSWVTGPTADVRQAHYNNGNLQYYGVMEYSRTEFQSWVVSTYGADVYANLVFGASNVYMYRVAGVPNSSTGAVNVHLWVTSAQVMVGSRWDDATVMGGGESVTVAGPGPGAAAWIGITGSMARAVLFDGTVGGVPSRSFFVKDNNFSFYAHYYGCQQGGCVLQVNCSWNFTRPAVASVWL